MYKEISYNGITFKTNLYRDLSDTEYKYLLDRFHSKPSADDVISQLKKVHGGSKTIDKINRYYFFDLMCDVRTGEHRLSVNEFIQSRELCGHVIAKMEHSNMYGEGADIYDMFDAMMRLGTGSRLAQRPSNFKIGVADNVISKYCFNGNYYDYSCGWGVRLLSAMRNRVDYYGTDPNPYLCGRLHTLSEDYHNVNHSDTSVHIDCQGSETFIPEYENKMSLCFSSPPYYNIEDYRYGDQSYKPGVTYEQWKQNYLFPTLCNCYHYLVYGGYLCINIKDKDKYRMLSDSINYLRDVLCMKCVDSIPLVNGKRKLGNGNVPLTEEQCVVFQKL